MKIQSNQLVPGRLYSVVYQSDVDMVQQRDGANNPLFDVSVTVRRVATVQACGDKTYARMRLKQDADWQPSGKPKWYAPDPANTCVVVHRKTGVRYFRVLPINMTKETYFIGGKPASEAETATIKSFHRGHSDADYLTIRLENLINVRDNGGEKE